VARYGRRPVIAILDTGVREHPWLEVTPAAPGTRGYTTAPGGYVQVDQPMQDAIHANALAVATAGDKRHQLIGHPWDEPVTADPLVGEVGVATGHGVYICGIFRQVVPDATVLSIRIMHSDDVVYEGDLTEALKQLALRVARAQNPADPKPELMIDVLSLSFGYFSESSRDVTYTSGLKQAIDALLHRGVVVVAAAGNYAVSRRYYPAAFAAAPYPAGALPPVSVGELNPNGTCAMFSDGGRWVTAYAPGAMGVSTFPTDANGSLMPQAELRDGGQIRASLDPDDFRGGFAAWNGTSFAAPALAAWITGALLDGAEGDQSLTLSDPSPAAAVSRALHALRQRGWRET
jgi:hypothetical protein